jgi:DNA-binding MarR family transcriptional regulator
MAPDLAQELRMQRPFESAELEAFLNLVRTSDQLQSDFSELFRPHGLTMQQYNVLRILRGAGSEGLPCLEIGRRMVTRVPDVTRLIHRMEKAGLVHRERSEEDRRVVRVLVTREGRRLADRLEAPSAARHREQLGHLSARELATLNRLLEKAREATRPD